MAKSIRAFGGRYSRAPIWVSVSEEVILDDQALINEVESRGVEIRNFRTPENARWLYYGGKPYAAAEAESEADGRAETLVWIDEDTIVISEPSDFDLKPGISLAYVPVMHNRSGSLFDLPPDVFWSRIYEKLAIASDALFPMITPADEQKIRAYFHCGLAVVRPQKGVLRRWAQDFELLHNDTTLVDMCKSDATRRIFLHQTALTGAVLHTVAPDEMMELSPRYNYPIFFEKQYDANRPYDSIENVVTVRCAVSLEKMGPDWHKKLSGPPDTINWLKEHFDSR
jgi:hypothetical protein